MAFFNFKPATSAPIDHLIRDPCVRVKNPAYYDNDPKYDNQGPA